MLVRSPNQNIARTIEISSVSLLTEFMHGLFHKITEWCIKYEVMKQLKNCFKLPNNALMLCFDKITCAQNNEIH